MNRILVRLTEAAVPRKTESMVTIMATSKLIVKAANQESLLMRLSYHFHE